jgi:hypothetical protein
LSRVILFAFWGRRENVELQLPFIRRILEQNPDVEFQGWDLARDPEDSKYIRSLPAKDRFQIRTDYYQGDGKASRGQNQVWRHYCSPQYRDCTFVKLDDDVSFIETAGIPGFIQAALDNPDAVISALTVNNGCSARHIPAVWDIYESLKPTLPKDATPHPELAKLLAVHRSAEYADRCHRWFHTNWPTLINQTPQLIPTEDWLSINAISYSYVVGKRIALRIGQPSPEPVIAGRPQRRLGDEGSANRQPRHIYTGTVCGHLTFGPQQQSATPGQVDEWRKMYADIARQYLEGEPPS